MGLRRKQTVERIFVRGGKAPRQKGVARRDRKRLKILVRDREIEVFEQIARYE